METTENFTHEFAESAPELVLTKDAQYFLHQAGRWARFLGIIGFVGTGLIFILALFVGTIFSLMSSFSPATAAMPTAGVGGLMSFFYILIAIFYFFLSLYLYRFGTRVKKGIAYADNALVTNALGNLKSHFKLIGITTIVVISLYILILAGVLILGVGAAAFMNR